MFSVNPLIPNLGGLLKLGAPLDPQQEVSCTSCSVVSNEMVSILIQSYYVKYIA